MRTLQEIQQEYTMVCAQLGDFEAKKDRFLAQLEEQRKALTEKIDLLEQEATTVKTVQAELDKEKNKAEALKDPAAVAASEVSNEQVQAQ